ncbi:MAG: menaquinone-dependent protoporphyrinogen oxidase [Actinomycetota bacterium]|jgi:menaquinone-dependent protoporphyrinogen oxidase|nr:menaquinone-dependent protoporphyrinogen oxidase [Actinomycetota bacterium]
MGEWPLEPKRQLLHEGPFFKVLAEGDDQKETLPQTGTVRRLTMATPPPPPPPRGRGDELAVLVGYASAHGSTRGIAERIAAQLGENGFAVAVRPVDEIDDVNEFDAVVVGSAIHDGAWLPEGSDFVHRHLTALASRPVWLFSVGLVGESSSAFPAAVAAQLRALRRSPKEIAHFRKATHALDHAEFAGAIQRDQWPRSDRVIFRGMRGRYGDHRDWDDIDAWTDEIVTGLRAAARAAARAATRVSMTESAKGMQASARG